VVVAGVGAIVGGTVGVVGWIIVIVFLAQNGVAGANQYGMDPKAA
jgi:uncharacterized membrane protein YhaH (DUF805 family)